MPAAKLFIAMITVDLRKLPELSYALLTFKSTVRTYLGKAKKFYGMTRFHRNQCTQLNLYPNYPEYMP